MSTVPNELPSVRRLLGRHWKVLEMDAAGHDQKVIAQSLGMSLSMVRSLQQAPLYQHELAKLRDKIGETQLCALDQNAQVAKARAILDGLAEKAATTMGDLLDSPDGNLRLRGADKILERVFGGKDDGSKKPIINITAEHVMLINQALKESQYVAVQSTNKSAPVYSQASEPELHQASGSDGGTADSAPAEGPTLGTGDVCEGSAAGQEDDGSGRIPQQDVEDAA